MSDMLGSVGVIVAAIVMWTTGLGLGRPGRRRGDRRVHPAAGVAPRRRRAARARPGRAGGHRHRRRPQRPAGAARRRRRPRPARVDADQRDGRAHRPPRRRRRPHHPGGARRRPPPAAGPLRPRPTRRCRSSRPSTTPARTSTGEPRCQASRTELDAADRAWRDRCVHNGSGRSGSRDTVPVASDAVVGSVDDKVAALEEELRRLGRVVVAFSGGADSAFLAAVAQRTLGAEHAHAVTAVSPSLAGDEEADCRALAARVGAALDAGRHRRDGPRRVPGQRHRPLLPLQGRADGRRRPDRRGRAVRRWCSGSTSTTSATTVPASAPPTSAVREFPLVDRRVHQGRRPRGQPAACGLRTGDKPAAACLASRIPYGTEVTVGLLSQVDRAEAALQPARLRPAARPPLRRHGAHRTADRRPGPARSSNAPRSSRPSSAAATATSPSTSTASDRATSTEATLPSPR